MVDKLVVYQGINNHWGNWQVNNSVLEANQLTNLSACQQPEIVFVFFIALLRWPRLVVSPVVTTMVRFMMSSVWLNRSHPLQPPGGPPVPKPKPAPETSTNQDSPWQVVCRHEGHTFICSIPIIWSIHWSFFLLLLCRSSDWRPHTATLCSEDCGAAWWTIQHYILILKQQQELNCYSEHVQLRVPVLQQILNPTTTLQLVLDLNVTVLQLVLNPTTMALPSCN